MARSVTAAIRWLRDESNDRDAPWYGLCLKMCRTAYGVAARYPTAAAGWRATKHRHKAASKPPRGALVWWSGGSRGYGHVAISDGGGYVWSTDIRRRGDVDRVKLASITRRWSLRYVGWSEDVNGVRVFKHSGYDAPEFPRGIGPWKSRPSAKGLQKALKAAGYMDKSVELADNYGPKTRDAVARFHNANPRFKSRRSMRHDVRIGPKGWAHLHREAYDK